MFLIVGIYSLQR